MDSLVVRCVVRTHGRVEPLDHTVNDDGAVTPTSGVHTWCGYSSSSGDRVLPRLNAVNKTPRPPRRFGRYDIDLRTANTVHYLEGDLVSRSRYMTPNDSTAWPRSVRLKEYRQRAAAAAARREAVTGTRRRQGAASRQLHGATAG